MAVTDTVGRYKVARVAHAEEGPGRSSKRKGSGATARSRGVQDGSQVVWGVQLGGAGASSMLPIASSGQRIV